MVSIAMLIGGALINALAFTGSSYMFSSLSKKHIDKERKRHDLAVEKLQKAQIEWSKKRQERIDFINKQLIREKNAEVRFSELNDAMKEYYNVFKRHLQTLPREPMLKDFYTPSNDQHERELAFITLSMILIGGTLYYYEKK